MASFMDIHKVVVKRRAFWTFSSARNESESKGGAKSEGLKHQFSQVEGDLDLQEMIKLVPIPNKNTKEKDNYDVLCLCSSIICKKENQKKT